MSAAPATATCRSAAGRIGAARRASRYNAWARTMAPVINRCMREGIVDCPALAARLTSEQVFSFADGSWSAKRVLRLLDRLRQFGLLEIVPRGPYASAFYSSTPRKGSTEASRVALRLHADRWARMMKPVIADIKRGGVNGWTAIATELNRRGVTPQRGGLWTKASVRNLMYRLRDLRGNQCESD